MNVKTYDFTSYLFVYLVLIQTTVILDNSFCLVPSFFLFYILSTELLALTTLDRDKVSASQTLRLSTSLKGFHCVYIVDISY